MNETKNWEQDVRTAWDAAKEAGRILYRADTLTIKDIEHEGTSFHLIHNGIRDVFDRASADGGDRRMPDPGEKPELARSEDGDLIVYGNQWACMQYQCLLFSTDPAETLAEPYLQAVARFASAHPRLTLMHNAIGAGRNPKGKDVFWGLSFSTYEALVQFDTGSELFCRSGGIDIFARQTPCHALRFSITGRELEAARLLAFLVETMSGINYNIFFHDGKAVFIPREACEIPPGFDGHRFGGLEMLGCFVMKTVEDLENADPTRLLAGIEAISYQPSSQAALREQLERGDGE